MTVALYDVENFETIENCENAINQVKEIVGNENILQFAYAEWGRLNSELRQLFVKYGIIQKQVINGIGYYNNIKNIADIALAIDTIELIIKNQSINHIILVSGDGGYISLINKLKEYGKEVSIVSLEENLNNSLKNFVNNIYTFKKQVIEEIKVTENSEYTPEFKQSIITFRDKKIWATAKNSKSLEDFCNNIIINQNVLESLYTEPINIFFIVKSYLKAKNTLETSFFHQEVNKAISYLKTLENNEDCKIKVIDTFIHTKQK